MKKTSDNPINRDILGLVLTSARSDLSIRQDYDNSVLYYMMLICRHPKLMSDIREIRADLAIEVINYSWGGSIGDIMSLPWNYGAEKYKQILQRVTALSLKYNLGDNWVDSLMVYAVTDVLPPPTNDVPIEWHPYNQESSGRVKLKSYATHFFLNEDLGDSEIAEHYYKSMLLYPSIRITERLTSKNQLKNWIDENWDEHIEPELRKIPSRLKPAASVERLALGLWLWELKELKKLNWDQIEKEIDSIEERNPDFFGTYAQRVTPDRAKGPDLIYSAKSTLAEFYPF